MELSGFGGASSGKDGRIPKEKRLDFLKEIIPYFEIIKGGREDCQCLFGTDALNEKEIAGKFIDWGAKVSVITIGEEGALVVSGDKSYQFPIFPAKVVDCTGAGDVFHAGFLTEYLNSGDLQKSARFALATASLIIERTGGVVLSRMPVREEVLERMRKK